MSPTNPTLPVPAAVIEIARRLEDAGYETWAVGGAIRDALGPQPTIRPDWDLATAARPDAVRKLFRRSYPIGIEFGTVGVRGSDGVVYEVTTFRRDISTDGRHAVVEYSDTIDEDLSRRDFTINAIAYHPLTGDIRDPFDGRADLERGILRCVGAPALRFAEDYLRVLRGLRFAGLHELEVDPPTWAALVGAVSRLGRLSGERVREELLKVLAAPDPEAALDLYRTSGALAELIPELGALDDAAWAEINGSVRCLPREQAESRLAALFAGVNSPLRELMERLRFSNAEIRETSALTEGLRRGTPDPADRAGVRRWVSEVNPERALRVMDLHRARAEARGASAAELKSLESLRLAVVAVLERGDPVTLGALAIKGDDLRDLGLSPGPLYATILGECLEAVLEDPGLNERTKLLAFVRERYSN